MDKLPTDSQTRKDIPVYTGCLMYFPLALAAVARLSLEGQKQHNPDKPLAWDRSKSGDENDALMRHLIDKDHVHVAWRALANLQKELENGYDPFGWSAEQGADEDNMPYEPLSFGKWLDREGYSWVEEHDVYRSFAGWEISNPTVQLMYSKYCDDCRAGSLQPHARDEP